MRQHPETHHLVAALIALFALAPSVSFAQEAENRSLLCRLKKEVRTLRIEKDAEGKCKTSYTKSGKDQVIGEAQNMSSCEEVVKKVQDTLEAAGWKCREMKDARVSNLNETIQ